MLRSSPRLNASCGPGMLREQDIPPIPTVGRTGPEQLNCYKLLNDHTTSKIGTDFSVDFTHLKHLQRSFARSTLCMSCSNSRCKEHFLGAFSITICSESLLWRPPEQDMRCRNSAATQLKWYDSLWLLRMHAGRRNCWNLDLKGCLAKLVQVHCAIEICSQ